jgi:PAS domain S-box-containing protein
MPLFSLIILILELWCLAALALALHRFSAWTGLAPLLVFMGGLTLLLQRPGALEVVFDFDWFIFRLTSHGLLPVLLLSLLLIYVVNGSSRARFTLEGMLLLTAVGALIDVLQPFHAGLPGSISPSIPAYSYTVRRFLASGVALAVDMGVLILVYQTVCNLRRRYPSRLAGTLALLAALWADGLLYSTVLQVGTPAWGEYLWNDMVGKTIPALALWPPLALYLTRVAPRLPHTSANMPRPLLDVFTTRLQLEARARYHYSLLRTLSEINQLILRTNEPRALIEMACSLLVSGRDYSLVWIGLGDARSETIQADACAGQACELGRQQRIDLSGPAGRSDHPAAQALRTRRSVVVANTALHHTQSDWIVDAFRHSLLSQAAFPMRHGKVVYGVLNVYSQQANAFDNEEIEMLQELADDLAYALLSLEARRQQGLLHTAAENMRDGLLITDLDGKVVYANPVLCAALGAPAGELQGQDIVQHLPDRYGSKFASVYVPSLLRDGRLALEMDYRGRGGERISADLHAALAHDPATQQSHIVINVRDATYRRRYEHQLLTLNHLTADLVQIHEPAALLSAVLHTCEDMLAADASAVYMLEAGHLAHGTLAAHHTPGQGAQQVAQIFTHIVQQPGFTPLEPLYTPGSYDPLLDEELNQVLDPCAYRSLLLLPIQYQQRTLGLMGLFYNQRRSFREEELQLGSTVTHTLAIVLQNAHLYQAEHSQRQMAEALAQAGMLLNSSLDLDQVLDYILEGTVRVVFCQTVNLMLVEGPEVRVVRHFDPNQPNRPNSPEIYRRVIDDIPTLSTMMAEKKPLLLPDTHGHPLWSSFSGSDWIRSYAAAPLEVRGEVIGFLNINSSVPNSFNEDTLQQLQAFAAAAATAIQNASLYQNLQRHTLELEDRVRARTFELSAAKERIEAILVSVPDAVFVLDQADALIQANPAGDALQEQAAAQGLPLFSPGFLASLQDGPHPNEKAILEVGGRAYQALASSLTSASGTRAGSVIVFRDVTRFRELDKMKSQFVSDVSHELRTPLTNLTLYLDLLAHNIESERRSAYMGTLLRETERLTHLIEDLLTISRLEAGREQMRLQPVNVRKLVHDLTQDRSSMAAERGLGLNWNGQPGLAEAQADPRLLTQVLSNLLTNALNYTPAPGEINIHIGVGERQGQTYLTIAISDTGVGIPADDLQHIFERFFRGDAGRKTGASGTGLGLAISKEIIERMQGSITVESAPGQGSTFTVWLLACESHPMPRPVL